MLTPDQERALVGTLRGKEVAETTIYRARRDPEHPAYRATPSGPTRDKRCDQVEQAGSDDKQSHVRLVTRAPEDAVRAFWSQRRYGPRRATPTQEAK